MGCDRKSCGNQQGDNKFTRMGISRRVAPLGTVPVGTIEAFADMVPWGTKQGREGRKRVRASWVHDARAVRVGLSCSHGRFWR